MFVNGWFSCCGRGCYCQGLQTYRKDGRKVGITDECRGGMDSVGKWRGKRKSKEKERREKIRKGKKKLGMNERKVEQEKAKQIKI
jgi:hypothetical protein